MTLTDSAWTRPTPGNVGTRYLMVCGGCKTSFPCRSILNQILAPDVVRMRLAEHNHGDKARATRHREQIHICFFRRPVALAAIAWTARRDHILPGRRPMARPRHHVVER